MKQFLLPADYSGESEYTLIKKDFHYLCRVRRLNKNDQFTCLSNDGIRYTADILSIEDSSCTIQLLPLSISSSEDFRISLFFCIPKGKKSDQIVKQATELGVTRIIPVLSQNCVVRLKDEKEKNQKKDRWKKIVREATQQSGSLIKTSIEDIAAFNEIPSFTKDEDISLVLYEKTSPKEKGFHQRINKSTKNISLLIGAEGGLTEKEIQFLIDHRFSPVSFGENILRAETAVVAGVSTVKILLQESTQWNPSNMFPE